MLGVTSVNYVPLPMQGRLMAEPQGVVVEISARLSSEDRRFALAHELSHLVLNDIASGSQRVDSSMDSFAYSTRERLCDVGATEMLMPTDWLETLFPVSGKSLGVKAVRAAEQAKVKVEAVVERVMELGLWEGTALWLRLNEGHCIPYKSMPFWDDSVLARVSLLDGMEAAVTECIRRNALYAGPMTLEILGQREAYVGECVPIGQGRALAVLTTDG
jgi:hypothetical protein